MISFIKTLRLAGAAALITAAFSGCSTPGVNHAYVGATGGRPILDFQPGSPVMEVPSHLFAANELYGIAYDPFTDHLFLRVAPGYFIRVVDRPARKVKRDFIVEGLSPGRGDLAIRSSDRHLFYIHPTLPALVESNLNGRFVRTVTLDGLSTPPAGLAYDQKKDLFYVLVGGDLAHVDTYSLAGKRLGGVALDRNVRLTSLAFDSVAKEFYAPLLGSAEIGIFSPQGHLLRTLPVAADGDHDFVDVGPRSLLRLF